MPDGSCDLTAHVAVDSLEHDEATTQRDALHTLGPTPAPPTTGSRAPHRRASLAALADASALGALTSPDGLGGFRWVLRRVSRM